MNLLNLRFEKIAQENELITADKKDSQGLCFIGKVRLPEFLQQKLKPKEGQIVEIDSNSVLLKKEPRNFDNKIDELAYNAQRLTYSVAEGKVVGKHQGAHYFTKGQRKGLAVGGTPEPLFVIETDVDQNVIYTGQGKDHPGLFRKALFVSNQELHWVREDLKLETDQQLEVSARIRYRQPLQKATLYQVDSGVYVDFDQPQSAITEGQFVAFYQGEELIGSGVIG